MVMRLVFSTTLGGNVYPWGSPQVVGIGVLGVALLVAFALADLLDGWSHEQVARLLGRLTSELFWEEPEPVLVGTGSSHGGGR